jgi:xylulokinase
MLLLGLDIGSSSVKAGLLKNGALKGRVVRESFPTSYDGVRAEVDADAILRAIAGAIRGLGSQVRRVDAIALSTMAPSWVAMDKRGRAITPLVTHQDRRSVEIAREIESRVGKARHLALVGNRPCPGGISSTTWAWFNQNHRTLMRRADLVGHLNTFLHRQITGARITDPSNASIMGLLDLNRWGWSDEVLDAIGGSEHQLPQIIGADGIGGLVTHAAGRRFGLTHGTPVLAGLIDTGGAVLLAGAKTGQLINVSGSTDVLALCVDRPRPHEKLITRALGVGRTWLSVSTIAAAGSTFNWLRFRLFSDLGDAAFATLMKKLAAKPIESSVRFEPYLAGERTSIEQRQAAFTGLTLATTREQMLSSAIEALARASAERIELLKSRGVRMSRRVLVTGGVFEGLGDLLHRNWAGKWTFQLEEEASLRGLALLAPE